MSVRARADDRVKRGGHLHGHNVIFVGDGIAYFLYIIIKYVHVGNGIGYFLHISNIFIFKRQTGREARCSSKKALRFAIFVSYVSFLYAYHE